MNATFLLLLFLQDPQPLPVLEPGVPAQGEVTDHSPVVATPTLKTGYTDVPIPGETFRFEVPESGPWHLDLRSYFFDPYLVLRDAKGRLLGEDDDGWIGVQSRIVADLEVGTEYRVTACALYGLRGAFELLLTPGKPKVLARQERMAADLAEGRVRAQAMESAKGPESTEVASALDSLAGIYEAQGRYEDAEPLYGRSLAIREKTLGPKHRDVAESLNNLTLLSWRQGRYQAAEPLGRRALAIRETVLGPDHPDVATSLNNLALLYQYQGRYQDAEPLYGRALAIREKVLGPDHRHVAESLNNLAVLYQAQGRYQAAAPLLERSLAILEKVLGPEHPNVAESLNNLAVLYEVQGRYQDAEPLLERALAISEKVLALEHRYVSTSLNNLGTLYESEGRYQDAEPLFERALAMDEKALGPEHPDVATSLNNIARIYEDQSRYQAAGPLLERALAIWEKVLGPEHPDVALGLNNLAGIYEDQGRFQDAQPLYERALAIRETWLGPDHRDVATSLNDLALLYQDQGRYREAEPLYERALAIWEKVQGPEHPLVATALNNLAVLYQVQGRYQAAAPLFERSLAIREKVLGPEHPDVAGNLNNLAELYRDQGRCQAAAPLFERALEIGEKVLGPEHPHVSLVLNNLAGLNHAQGRFQDAQPLYAQALRGLLHHLDRELPIMSEADRFQLLGVTGGPGRLLANTIRLETGAEAGILDLCLDWKGKATRLQAAGRKLAQQEGSPEVRRRIGALQGLQKELSTLVFLPADERGEDHEERVVALRTKRLDLERALNRDLGLDEVLATPSTADVQAALPGDAVLVDFYVGEDVFAWVVHREGPPALVSLGNAETLVRAQRAFLRRVGVGGARLRGVAAPVAEGPDSGVKVARLLWQPLATRVGNAGTVLVSPDSFLGELPFGILPDRPGRPDGEGHYLIEKHRFAYLSDASRIVEQDGPAAEREGAVLTVGDVNYSQRQDWEAGPALALAASHSRSRIGDTWPPLTATREEIQSLRGLHDQVLEWPSPFDQLDGKGATEEAVRAALPGHRYLHLATHGYFEPDELPSMMANAGRQGPGSFGEERRAVGLLPGLLSGLVLAGVNSPSDATRDDGYLSAEEIQYFDLSACDLAVLSACETALGSKRAGEGLQSLRRGFAVAGARTVLSSLWKVDDRATATLMRHFYENYWQKGMAKLDALHAAKLRMLRQNRADFQGAARPATWGAFVLSGDWR